MELYSSLNNQIFLMLTSHKQDHWVVGVVVRPCWSTKTNENDQKAPRTIRYYTLSAKLIPVIWLQKWSNWGFIVVGSNYLMRGAKKVWFWNRDFSGIQILQNFKLRSLHEKKSW